MKSFDDEPRRSDIEEQLRQAAPRELQCSVEDVIAAAARDKHGLPRRDDRIRLTMAWIGGLVAGVLLTLALQPSRTDMTQQAASDPAPVESAEGVGTDVAPLSGVSQPLPAAPPRLRPTQPGYAFLVAPGRVVSPRSLTRNDDWRNNGIDIAIAPANSDGAGSNANPLSSAPQGMLRAETLLNEILGASSL